LGSEFDVDGCRRQAPGHASSGGERFAAFGYTNSSKGTCRSRSNRVTAGPRRPSAHRGWAFAPPVAVPHGGHPRSRDNLWSQRWDGERDARVEDRLQRRLQVMFCAGDMTVRRDSELAQPQDAKSRRAEGRQGFHLEAERLPADSGQQRGEGSQGHECSRPMQGVRQVAPGQPDRIEQGLSQAS